MFWFRAVATREEGKSAFFNHIVFPVFATRGRQGRVIALEPTTWLLHVQAYKQVRVPKALHSSFNPF